MEQFKENYQNQNERMNPQLENMLKSMQSDLANNPAFPKTDANGNPINFIELIGYKRFLDVIEKVKRYTNLQNVTGGGLGQLSSMMMQGLQFIQQVEAPHKQELENLAVDLVVEEMEIPDGAFQFQCKLVPVGSINQDGFQKDAQEPNEEEINQAFENESQNVEIPADELFEDEKHKRRFINMLIQGSSKKGHYMFELVRSKVNEYNPNLAETYGKVMSINDLIYWLLDDETIKQMASKSSSMAGKEEIEEGEDGDTIIKTEAICFPVSLHEIIKGVMEVFGSQGLPDDPQQATLVIDSVDSLSNETMDLRLGVPCWEKIYGAYPDFILEEGNRYLQSYLFARYCALPTDEFFRVSRLILSDDPKGAKYFAKMVDEIQNDLQQEDYQKNIDDINLDDLLGYKYGGGVGIKSKGGIGKSGTQYGYTLKEWEKMARNKGLLVSPKQWWKSQEGKTYTDSFGRKKKIGQHSQDERQSMEMYGYLIANGLDLGSKIIPASAKKYVQENNYMKYSKGGGVRRYTGGGGVNSNYGKFGDDNSNLVNFDIDNLDAFEFRQYENFSKSLSKAQALQVLINDVEGDYSQLSEELSKIAEEQMPMDNYNNGGMIDLFEDYENIPANVKSILDYYELEESDYDTLNDLQNELADVGYTFDFGLDYQPYGLRPIGVKITELQGYEDFDDSDKFDGGGEIQIGDEVEFSVPYFENELFYKGKIIELKGRYAVVEYQSDNDRILRTNLDLSKLKKAKFNGGGEAEFDVYNWDDKMALINLGQIYEYAIELDKIIDENTDLEEWVKMKLTRIEQNIADVKHSLEGWEKYSSGGEIAKKQLLHIAKYSKDLIEMISNGSKLMSWQEGKLSVSAQSIDDIYHHLDYKMGNRAVDLENESEDKFVDGGDVQGWMKEALLNLQLVEDDNSLQITHTNDDSFYVEGDSAEYRVFETYAIAYDTAIEQVREDLEENPDYFNQDWLMNWVDVDDTIENILEEYYRSYADDIAFEDDSRYNNRLIAEMVANGLMTEEEATSEDADDIAEDNVDNLVDLYVEENMEGDKGVEWYISNFGQDDFRDLVNDNNLIDISGASEDAVDTDGVAHFLSSYDGEEIELDNDVVAYRTN